MVSGQIANALHSEFANYLTYTGSTIFVTILVVLSIIYLVVPPREWRWIKSSVVDGGKKIA